MRKYICFLIFLSLSIWCIGCGNVSGSKDAASDAGETGESGRDNKIVVGFSQLGAESDWRSSNSESMKEALSEKNGYELIFDDGQQKQSNQITAIRKFIQQGVDYIVLAPVTETGWDTVLQEAGDAGIPVIIVDRMVDVSDPDLFCCWVGSDFTLEGKKASEWLYQYTLRSGLAPEDIHIVNIQGTLGASAQLGRTKGLADAVTAYGWDLLAEKTGDFTQAKGREVMAELLETYDNINVVYCENDNEALGAIEAIEAAGKTVGSDLANGDIMILSFDGVNEAAVAYAAEGKISCITECNPLHGSRVRTIIEALEAGRTPEKFEYVEEAIYSSIPDITDITVDGTVYPVTILTKNPKPEE